MDVIELLLDCTLQLTMCRLKREIYYIWYVKYKNDDVTLAKVSRLNYIAIMYSIFLCVRSWMDVYRKHAAIYIIIQTLALSNILQTSV